MESVRRYMTKPDVVEAIQFLAGITTRSEILAFCPQASIGVPFDRKTQTFHETDIRWCVIECFAGSSYVGDTDFIVKHADGRFTAVHAPDFRRAYSPVP